MSSSLRLFHNSILRLEKWGMLCRRYKSIDTNVNKEDIIDITSVDVIPKYEKILTEHEKQEILRKRNKSRLNQRDRNFLFNIPPYNEDLMWFHETIRYKRRMFGRYGMKGLNVPAGILWPTQEEIDDKMEYEKVLNPHTIQESWAIIAKRNQEEAERIRLRDESVAKKMASVDKWSKELKAKIAKKEAELLAAKQRREKVIELVRRQFGFQIDPRDERFKLALEQKEKDDKKRMKLEKKEKKNAEYMAMILSQFKKRKQPKETENETNDIEK